jgi:multidrug transporter EmrE-like cation transporter
VLISLFSVVILRESFDVWRVAGMVFILAGIALLARSL